MTLTPELKSAAQKAVDHVMSEIHHVKACLVATEDGFEVAASMVNAAEIARLSAMAGSMAALAAIASEESHIGVAYNVVVQAGEGHLVMVQVRRADVSLVLSIVAGSEALMGQLLYVSKQTAQTLEQT